MSGQTSILGTHSERVKTDVRLSAELTKQVEAMCAGLGVPKNVFFTLAACELLIKLSPLVKNPDVLQKSIESLLQKIKKNLSNSK